MKKQKVVLAAGVYPPQIGGPAKYAKNMHDELIKKGFEVKVATYFFEHKLPIGIRHLWYFFRLLFLSLSAKTIFAFDTLSTGVPATLVGKILGKKVIVRIGGDFLWETHVETTGEMIPLPLMYKKKDSWSKKDRLVYKMTNFLFRHGNMFVFNTFWLRDIFLQEYSLKLEKTAIIKNVFSPQANDPRVTKKTFLWAGRSIKLKNIENFTKAFLEAKKQNIEIEFEMITSLPQNELMKKIEDCYALVLPSFSDVAPNFVIEGIERGKPFLCTKYTGLATDFPDCGIFVDPLDMEDMKKGILELARDEVYEEKTKAIRQYKTPHSFKDITDEFITITQI